MASYQRGSKGPEVTKIQTRLKELAFYRGPLDGDFGGGTESAVKGFQAASKLTAHGLVGSVTCQRLLADEQIPTPAISQKPLSFCCLALSGSIETGAPIPDCFAGISVNGVSSRCSATWSVNMQRSSNKFRIRVTGRQRKSSACASLPIVARRPRIRDGSKTCASESSPLRTGRERFMETISTSKTNTGSDSLPPISSLMNLPLNT